MLVKSYKKTLANENRTKEARDLQKFNEKPNRPVYVLECDSNCSDDEGKDVYAAEVVWPSNDKPCVCGSLKPIHKDWQEIFSFDVSKYEMIFDELYKNGYIKMSHVILLFKELKRRAYCKIHNTFSHTINDCNMLRRQIQSAVNEGRIIVPQMKVIRIISLHIHM